MCKICMARLLNCYIQDDVSDILKEHGNQSKLINDLLREHFKKVDLASMSVNELMRLKATEQAKLEYESKLKEIEHEHK